MTATPLESTWPTRDLPILPAALRRLDAGAPWVELGEIRRELGLDETQLRAGLRALECASPPYIQVSYLAEGVNGHIHAVSERARRELGSWPSAESVVDRLAAALAEAADAGARRGGERLRSLALRSGSHGGRTGRIPRVRGIRSQPQQGPQPPELAAVGPTPHDVILAERGAGPPTALDGRPRGCLLLDATREGDSDRRLAEASRRCTR